MLAPCRGKSRKLFGAGRSKIDTADNDPKKLDALEQLARRMNS